MKSFCFLFLVGLAAVSAHPIIDDDTSFEGSTCKLADLIPKGDLPQISFDIDRPEAVLAFPDPLPIKNTTVNLDGKIIKGTYSFTNGLLEGLSTLNMNYAFDPTKQRFSTNETLERVKLTGLYEIINGQVNSPILGVHNYSGKGLLAVEVTGVVSRLSFVLQIEPYLSIRDLSIDLDFKNATVIAKDLVVDDVTVDWDEVNQNLRPNFEQIWGQQHDQNVQLIQQEINRLLEGCTLLDLIGLMKP